MALSQRPAVRFFAAFYRWNCYTQIIPCVHVASRQAAFRPSFAYRDARHYTAMGPCRQDATNKIRNDEEETTGKGIQQAHTQKLRSLMRLAPNSVVVLTAAANDPKTKQPIALGTALSSFTTVSLDPPYVSFNIKAPSQTLDAIRAKRLFCVHFFSDELRSAKIVDAFTRGNTPQAFVQRRALTTILHHGNGQMAILSSPHVVAALECELSQEVPVADHVVIIAKVINLANVRDAKSTILYHNGKYKKNDGTVLPVRQDNGPAESGPNDNNVYWNQPLFPGEVERCVFVEYIRNHIQSNPNYFEMDTREAVREMSLRLNLPVGALGIEYSRLMEDCKIQAGHSSQREKDQDGGPILPEFWGRLTPTDIGLIVDRARTLFKNNPAALGQGCESVLGHLGVHSCSIGLLARDILEPLRAEGIVGPNEIVAEPNLFASRTAERGPTLEALEKIELELKKHFLTGTYETMYTKSAEAIAEAMGYSGQDWIIAYVDLVRPHILAEAFPALFSSEDVDLRGHLTQEEVLIAVARIVQAMALGKPKQAHYRLKVPIIETLRQLGIHPMISGIDPSFLFGKITHLDETSPTHTQFKKALADMREPLYTSGLLQWDDFVTRARHLVRKHVQKVLVWPREDLLAAMGIDRRAKVKSPLRDKPPALMRGHTLVTVISRELKTYYEDANASPEEKSAIAQFLDKIYGYKIQEVVSSSTNDTSTSTSTSTPTSTDERQNLIELMREFGIFDPARHLSPIRSKSSRPADRKYKYRGSYPGKTYSSPSTPEDGPHRSSIPKAKMNTSNSASEPRVLHQATEGEAVMENSQRS